MKSDGSLDGRDILIYLSLMFEGDWDKIYEAISSKEEIPDKDIVIKAIQKIKCKTVTLLDNDYPNSLKQCQKPPFVIYYYGDLSLAFDVEKTISVVGTRGCSSYGIAITKKIVSSLSTYAYIVSGLAAGIDSVSHCSAIESGGRTIAVLGTGIDYCYPHENIDLYEEIKKNHLLISEYPGNFHGTPDTFPYRNRIIAALGKGLLITEASMRSGTSITATQALNLGKEICCVPSHADKGSLCNRLIFDGACLVETAEDVLDMLDFKR